MSTTIQGLPSLTDGQKYEVLMVHFAGEYSQRSLEELPPKNAAADVDKGANQREAIRTARLASFEAQDAIQVLEIPDLHPATRDVIAKARGQLQESTKNIQRNKLEAAAKNLKEAIELLERARAQMVKGIP